MVEGEATGTVIRYLLLIVLLIFLCFVAAQPRPPASPSASIVKEKERPDVELYMAGTRVYADDLPEPDLPEPSETPTRSPTAIPTQAPVKCASYVSPSGSDSGTGTESDPWASLEGAAAQVEAGCTVYIADGTYSGRQVIKRRFTEPTTFKAINAYHATFENADLVLDLDGAANIILEGLVFRHSGPTTAIVAAAHEDDGIWAENIVIRNSVFHDSYGNDLLKPHRGVRGMLIENSVFYNQGSTEEHLDINGVIDVTVRRSIFFNDYEASGRAQPADTGGLFIFKDSGGDNDGVEGSRNVVFADNIVIAAGALETDTREPVLKLGGDGRAYYELIGGNVSGNLFLAQGGHARAWVGIFGVSQISITNNTFAGHHLGPYHFALVETKSGGLASSGVAIEGNVFDDSTGAMPRFSGGSASAIDEWYIRGNTYWNGGLPLPGGQPIAPADDPEATISDPGYDDAYPALVLPTIDRLLAGHTIAAEYERIKAEVGGGGE